MDSRLVLSSQIQTLNDGLDRTERSLKTSNVDSKLQLAMEKRLSQRIHERRVELQEVIDEASVKRKWVRLDICRKNCVDLFIEHFAILQ